MNQARVVLTAIACGAFAGSATASGPGTLDRLTRDYRAHVSRALGRMQPAQQAQSLDLAFVVRAGEGVSPELIAVSGRLLAGQLRQLGFRSVHQITPAHEAVLARQLGRSGFELLLDSTLSLRSPLVHLRGELRDLAGAFWHALTHPPQETLFHLHASVRIDAEIHAFQRGKETTRKRFALTRYGSPVCPVVALAGVQDKGGSGRAELVALQPRGAALLMFSGRATGFSLRSRVDLPGPAPQVGSRRKIGSIAVLPGSPTSREMLVRTSATAGSFRLTLQAGKLRLAADRAGAYPLGVLASTTGSVEQLWGRLEEGTDRFVSAGITVGANPLSAEQLALLPATFYRLQVASAETVADKHLLAFVGVDGRLILLDQQLRRAVASLQTVGAAFVVGDIDADGAWDLVSSSAGPPDGRDDLSLHRLTPAGQLVPVSHHRDVGGVVTALAEGDFDGDGRSEIVAAVEKRGGRCALVQLD